MSAQEGPDGVGEASQAAQLLVARYGLACAVMAGPLGTSNVEQALARGERCERALLAYIAELERRAGAEGGEG